MKPRKRAHKRLGTFGGSSGVFVTTELRESAAYKSLTATERLVLFDMLQVYGRVSRADTESIRDTGFCFPLSACIEEVDSKTFVTARRRICEKGFFARAPKLESARPGSPHVYLPDTRWREYQPVGDEQRRVQKKARRRKQTLERNASRKRAFVQAKTDAV